MSREDQMQYLESPQTLRNKDYVTISRNDFNVLSSARRLEQNLYEREKRISASEIDLNRREAAFKKKELSIRYDLHKKLKSIADSVLKYEGASNE